MDGFEIELVTGGQRTGKTSELCIALKETANRFGATKEKPLRVATWSEDTKKFLDEHLFILGVDNVSIEVGKPRSEKPKLVPLPNDFLFNPQRYW